jgi:hypothetical protein
VWTQADRDKAIAWHLRQLATCPRCGTRAEEWAEDQGGRRDAYVAEIHLCAGCEAVQLAQASITPEDGRGVHVQLRRQPRVS